MLIDYHRYINFDIRPKGSGVHATADDEGHSEDDDRAKKVDSSDLASAKIKHVPKQGQFVQSKYNVAKIGFGLQIFSNIVYSNQSFANVMFLFFFLGEGEDINKPKCRKAKVIRAEKKKEKMMRRNEMGDNENIVGDWHK